MKIKGKLLLIGGSEDKKKPAEKSGNTESLMEESSILKLLCPARSKAIIEIITTGSEFPKETFERYENFFETSDVAEVRMLDITSRNLKSEDMKRVETASSIFISGGNQEKLLDIIGDTPLVDVLKKRYREDDNFILGGTSAGAMVLSEMTISDSIEKEKLIKGNVDIRKGMNLLNGTIVDTHFFQRMRFTRLALGLLYNPSLIGIGLPENTGVLVKDGYLLEPAGSEMALIMDASSIDVSNFEKAKFCEPVYAGGMKVHFLNEGSVFSLNDRRLYPKIQYKAG